MTELYIIIRVYEYLQIMTLLMVQVRCVFCCISPFSPMWISMSPFWIFWIWCQSGCYNIHPSHAVWLCMQICGWCCQCRWENMTVVRFLWVWLVSTRDWLFKSDRTWFECQTSCRGGTTRAHVPLSDPAVTPHGSSEAWPRSLGIHQAHHKQGF